MRLTSIIVLYCLNAASSAARLGYLRHASVDCRGGLFILARVGYTALGVSGELNSQPTSRCVEHVRKDNPLLRFYNSFESCGVKLTREDSERNASYKAYVWLGMFGVDNGTKIDWETKERIDCPIDPEPPLLFNTATVEEGLITQGKSSYRLDLNISKATGFLHVKFCEAYDSSNDSLPVINGDCVLFGEIAHVRYNGVGGYLTVEHQSALPIQSYACRVVVRQFPQQLAVCNSSEFERQSVLVHEDTLYDGGTSVFCQSGFNRSGRHRRWPPCAPLQFFPFVKVLVPSLPTQPFEIPPQERIRFLPTPGCESFFTTLSFLCVLAAASFLIGLAIPMVIFKLPLAERRRNSKTARKASRKCAWLSTSNSQT